jgi:hypothetical protein
MEKPTKVFGKITVGSFFIRVLTLQPSEQVAFLPEIKKYVISLVLKLFEHICITVLKKRVFPWSSRIVVKLDRGTDL